MEGFEAVVWGIIVSLGRSTRRGVQSGETKRRDSVVHLRLGLALLVVVRSWSGLASFKFHALNVVLHVLGHLGHYPAREFQQQSARGKKKKRHPSFQPLSLHPASAEPRPIDSPDSLTCQRPALGEAAYY